MFLIAQGNLQKDLEETKFNWFEELRQKMIRREFESRIEEPE